MKKIFSASIFIVLFYFISCTKDSINTKPSLKLKSFNPEVVLVGDSARVLLDFTDKEGDLDTMYILKKRQNKRTTTTIGDSLYYAIADIDKNQTGTIDLYLKYSLHLISAINAPVVGGVRESDSLIFKFWLKDKAKNVSDTCVSSLIVVKR